MAIVVNGKKVAGVGLPGKDGAPGADGKDGAPGKSAYQAAKEKGYTGTEEEFNTALAGMQSAPFLPLSGGTVEGVLEIRSGIEFGYGSNSIELSPSSASRLELVANASGGFSGGSIGGTVELIGLSAPTASNSAANKQYVDEHTIMSAVGASTGSVTLPFTPDAVWVVCGYSATNVAAKSSMLYPDIDVYIQVDFGSSNTDVIKWDGNTKISASGKYPYRYVALKFGGGGS